MTFDDKTLSQIWQVEMEILDVVHNICQKNNLRYSLAFGTLIGAVRHKGFIPWDDDIDIVMPREDYNKLLSIWNDSAPSEYFLQNKDTDPDFEQNFTKIRKNHTTFLQYEEERSKLYHKGIFVDIAPCDRVAPGKFSRKIQYFASAVELLYSKEHTSDTGGIIGLLERILLIVPKKIRPALRKKSRNIMSRWNNNDSLQWFCSDTIQNCRRYFSPQLFDSLILVSYEDRKYFAFAKPDYFLNVRYNDYMQLPPEEERVWKHHPIIVDFEYNYEEIKNKDV